MSRVGRSPVIISKEVTVDFKNGAVHVSGPKGKLSKAFSDRIEAKIEDDKITLERKDEEKKTKALHGLSRSILANMVIGVSEGFSKTLEIVGIGYKAEMIGKDIVKFNLGYSHPINFTLPDSITASVEERGTRVVISGIDKEMVGQTAAKMKKLRMPDSYKGKGVRYAGEQPKLKPGKAGVKK